MAKFCLALSPAFSHVSGMTYVLFGLALLAMVLLLARWLVTTTPEKAYPVLVSLALALVGLAAFMALTGRLAAAVPFVMGAWVAYRRFRQIRGVWRQATGRNEKVKWSSNGQITRDEAYEILGLKPGASLTEIQVAYKKLMQKLHPDKEGNEYLARKVNQARDTLLDKK